MRIDIEFKDRVGIAHEILAVLAKRGLNVVGVEVDPPHIYIDSPELLEFMLPDLQSDCQQVRGVGSIGVLDVLPGMRRRLHLDTMMAAMQDPVLAIDGAGRVVIANAAAAAVAGLSEALLCQRPLREVLDDEGIEAELISAGLRLPSREVSFNGEPFFMDVTPVADPDQAALARSVGAVLTFHTPARIGGRIHALQNTSGHGFDLIIGESEPIRALKIRAARVAAVDAPLLITGETGTGKELLAQACHGVSSRCHASFLELNCAALPESLAESELFGYMAGAFTGAQRGGKPGLFEMADGGTVFLDEIGEMSLYLQAKLLRFLNDGKFRRIGGDKEVRVNVRIISATHRNLRKMVQEGLFREDLFYRLNVLHLEMPPLRERPDDVLPLARHFIERACTQAQKSVCRLNTAACAALVSNRWPGNVRQLQNVVFRAITMSDQRVLDVADLDWAEDSISAEEVNQEITDTWELALQAFEQSLLSRLYPQYPSSRKLAARLETSHSVMATKLRKYGIGQKR
ncbi:MULTISPECIES: sigma 54-interacting transcriptional regulator [unclassified Undibacterium]|uniref:sigma 54-interacting transcriptional regulator n=1 Tax=unclassified Undibacterium TaxID=2630295 RepID=UPI002AC9429B|nr:MULTISPECIES: sigma 54-interacting transcriptional regulator [unclassified Undibacterium]MEB0138216.1 sigma 54-interacting transcriptional regulator [Undibacterium sp. CCC2.1]MEB0171623.1 sigma 54-interacting transcriptional regulator [Undibacterium sp. CCC1.1]MEB0175457.1 sigma 54-interacting transcriptional regulator [Undibacterium sp. CCC3.4]MEB0214823.1 sigma 54-interacting transcriptional regulator [Undibacterium sp. 5I2]WPX45310.1 sigma 54-interacting transcriptional regulator [Undiba